MVDILAIGAHPDDVEFGCGGVLVKMAAQGKKIVICDLTMGDKGTNGTPELRMEEGRRSAGLIGAERIYLDFKDCEIFDSYESRLKVVTLIRRYRPRLVLAPYWKEEQNHPDHLACGIIARHACRLARFTKILPELPTVAVEGILHYLPPSYDTADILIDVSDSVELWRKMMESHASQMKTFDYAGWTLRQASKLGMLMGVSYAQGFIKGNPIVVEDLMVVAKGTREI